ncbi:MAG: SAM-dependent methyltransferase [Candidatus Aenigmatarchaeota archaeon]
MIITKKEFDYLLANREKKKVLLKVNFFQEEIEVEIKKDKAYFSSEIILDLKLKLKDNSCYVIDEQGFREISYFSTSTNRFYKLVPTLDWPTITISGVPMHKLNSPKEDTQNKISFLKPYGVVLDTCMGLGYSAILCSKKAKKVITFEKDEFVFSIAKLNPLSKELFFSENIEIRREDITIGIKEFPSGFFDCILHDPPTFKISPQLYSLNFYKELWRTLRPKGKLFHYTPLYKIKSGFNFPSKIREKLKKANFKIINFSLKNGGFLCQK